MLLFGNYKEIYMYVLQIKGIVNKTSSSDLVSEQQIATYTKCSCSRRKRSCVYWLFLYRLQW